MGTDQQHIEEQLRNLFGPDSELISAAKLYLHDDRPDDIPGEAWGLLLISGDGEQLVFYHFDQDGWLEMMSSKRRVVEDLAICFPASGLTLEYREEPGFIKRLIRSDVGKIRLRSNAMIKKTFEGMREVGREDYSGPCGFTLDVDSVGKVADAIVRILPRNSYSE